MTTSKDVVSSDTAREEVTISHQKLNASEPFPLRRLPLELRRKIYQRYLVDTRHPSLKAIYDRIVPCGSRDRPSLLLAVNRQVRNEVLDLIQTWPIILRVTHHGVRFSSLAETCLIAQQGSRDYGRIPHLAFEIWPPHHDRPTDAIDIWRHLRKLRAELRAVPMLPRLAFVFADNEMASWTHNGEAIDLLDSDFDDLCYIMDLFSRVSAARVCIRLPRSLKSGKTTEHIRIRLHDVRAMMMGLIPIDEDAYNDEDQEAAEYQDWVDETTEFGLQRTGARIARDRLDVLTRHGRIRLTQMEWEYFIDEWSPDFEHLSPREFKGKLHYVQERDPWDSP